MRAPVLCSAHSRARTCACACDAHTHAHTGTRPRRCSTHTQQHMRGTDRTRDAQWPGGPLPQSPHLHQAGQQQQAHSVTAEHARARALKCIARDHRAVQRWRGDARAGADGVARIANAARGGRRGYRPRCAWVHRLALCLPTSPPTRLALRQWHHHGPRVRARRRFGICHGSLSSAEDVQPMIAIGATGPQLAAAAGRRSIVSAAAAGMVRRPGCPRAHIGDVLTAAASSS